MCIYLYSGHRIRIFMFGDYEFLCHMYGLSGASGLYTHIHALYQPSLLNILYQVVTVVFGARYNPTN